MSEIQQSQKKSKITMDFTVDPPVIRGYIDFTALPSLPPGAKPYLEIIRILPQTEVLQQTQEVSPELPDRSG